MHPTNVSDSHNFWRKSLGSYSNRDLASLVVVFFAYLALARFDLKLAHLRLSMGVVWLPAGISLAAVLLKGRRMAPAIFFAALLVGFFTTGSWAAAFLLAAANLTETLLAAYFIKRFAAGPKVFSRPADALRFCLLAGAVATSVSAIIGTSITVGIHGVPSVGVPSLFAAWWTGHALGVIVLTPFLVLLLDGNHHPLQLSELVEVAALLLGLSLICVVSFGPPSAYISRDSAPIFFCVPFLLWAAVRFCPLEASGACLLLCGFATWGSLQGYGPFAGDMANPLSLAAYLCVAASMTLVGAATVVKHREISEQLLETLYGMEQSKDLEITRLTSELDFLRDELIRRVHSRSLLDLDRQWMESDGNPNEVIWYLEAETENVLYVSPSYEKVWGRSREDLRSDAHAWLDPVLPEDREHAIRFVGEDFPGDRLVSTYRIRRPDGAIRWIFDRGFVIRDLTGRPIRFLGLASDVTELVELGNFSPARGEFRSSDAPGESTAATQLRRKQE